jgi:hypothetical protein
MKINTIKVIIAICVSGLIAYGFYSFHKTDNKLLLSLGSFVFLSLTLLFTLSISFSLSRTTTMIRTVSGIFFAIAFVSNLLFSFFNFSTPIYVIINGIVIMAYALIAYSIGRAKQ